MPEFAEPRNLDNHREACRVCQRRILRCFTPKGQVISVEACDFGRGRLAITRDMIDGRLVAATVNQGTSYRRHGCPTSSAFSAAGFKRKGPL
jgi:hypothetical protein